MVREGAEVKAGDSKKLILCFGMSVIRKGYPKAYQEWFVVRHPAAPPTSCMTSEDMAVTPALPVSARQLNASAGRCLCPVPVAQRVEQCPRWPQPCGQGSLCSRVRPSAPEECPSARRAEQPAQVVCGASPAAGLLPAGPDSGLTRFVARPGFPRAPSGSPAVQLGSCLGAQTSARARVRDPGQSCAAGRHG